MPVETMIRTDVLESEDASIMTSDSPPISLSSSSTPEPSAPPRDVRSIVNETMRGLKEVAQESYYGLKELAKLPKSWSPSRRSASGAREVSTDDERPWSPSVFSIMSPSNKNSPEERREAARKAMRDLMSPFLACHGGTYEPRSPINTTKQDGSQSVHVRQATELDKLKDRALRLFQNDSDTILSMDTAAEDEMMQLQRLTSWGTHATHETLDTSMSASFAETNDGTKNGAPMMDDDGKVIPQALIESAQKRREKRRRKRVVRFDYPPVSKLRECPRHNLEDLPDLFFTEEELNEIEADRSSTVSADDVEIVAVASRRSGDSSDQHSKYPSSPAILRKPRSTSPHPARPAKGSYPKSSSSSTASSTKSGDQRLIKGVQIYLRERSTGKQR